jgi:hypothetical protein
MIKPRTILASVMLALATGLISVFPGFHSNGQPLSGPASSPFRGIHTVLAAGAVSSLKSGNWSDPSTWIGGRVPGAADTVIIAWGHTVTYDLTDSRVSGVTIADNAKLSFAPGQTALLRTDKNILVLGDLEMKPSSATVHHTIRFVDVDELKFVGGGMNVVDTDIGLWVRGDGLLDIAGTPKTSWTRLEAGANAGNTFITLQSAPTGWRVGDEISIVPTEPPSVGNSSWSGFEVRTIQAISGRVVTLDIPLSLNHPAATDPNSGQTFTAEVLNLSRNVHIEGTGDGSADPTKNGRAHVQIHSTVPQFVGYAELKLLGPRRYTRESNHTAGALGRYALHFHHSRNGSRGSLIEGTVVRNAGGHSYVPHASHGITFRDTIAYDVWDDAYWWDPPPKDPARGVNTDNPINDSDNTLYDKAVAAIVKADPSFRGGRLAGFNLMTGLQNIVRDSVAVGVQGNSDASGFTWPEAGSDRGGAPSGVWQFNQGNISHNNKVHGIFTWQNNSHNHIVENFVGYYNGGSLVDHGAYVNNYQYKNVIAFGNDRYSLESHAVAPSNDASRADGYSLVFENYKTDGPLIFPRHNATAQLPTLFKDCIFTGVIVNDAGDGGQMPTKADFVNCTKPDGQSLEPEDFTLQQVVQGLEIRVQRPDGAAYRIQDGGVVTTIAPFYTTTPPNQAPSVSAGQSATITLPADASLAGSVIDDGLPNPPGTVTTQWSQVSGPGTVTFAAPNSLNTTATFTQEGIYVLRLTADDGAGVVSDDLTIIVNSASVNQAPFADAGADLTITLPDLATLNGSVSDDGIPNPPGSLTHGWRMVSGPAPVSFSDPEALATIATFTQEGIYILQLAASDSELTATDEVTITVSPPPTLTSITLSPASASVHSEGSIQFTAQGLDQNGDPFPILPTWSVSGGGTVDQTGLFTVGSTPGGPFTVTAADNSVSGTAQVSVTGQPDTSWVEDSLPTGASPSGLWNWVSSPTPYSGSLAHQSDLVSGLHQHFFDNATDTLTVAVGDVLFAYVFLDPNNPPSQVMLQWNNGNWEHRAYWGQDLISWGAYGTNSRRFMGPLPPVGQWIRLEVPAASVGLEGSSLSGMGFTLYDGRATWDLAGKHATPTNQPPAATIISPQDGDSFPTTDLISLQGSGTDAQDGELPGSALLWTSSIDGMFGTGRSFDASLSAGVHIITLTATDSQGASGSDTITITATPPPS